MRSCTSFLNLDILVISYFNQAIQVNILSSLKASLCEEIMLVDLLHEYNFFLLSCITSCNCCSRMCTITSSYVWLCIDCMICCRVKMVLPRENTGLLVATRFVYRTVEFSGLQESRSSVSINLQSLSCRPILMRLYMGQG